MNRVRSIALIALVALGAAGPAGAQHMRLTTDNPIDNQAPTLNLIANMTLEPGTTLDQTVSGSDPDGDALTFSKGLGPTFMTVTTTSPTTGNIHLASAPANGGGPIATVLASDGTLIASQSFRIMVCIGCAGDPPILAPISDMTVAEGMTADQSISATDPDGNSVFFFEGMGPILMTVSTIDPGSGSATGNIHLAPGPADAGVYSAMVRATNTLLFVERTFSITVVTAACAALVFNGYDTVRLGSGKPFWFGYVQPLSGCYANTDVVISSFVMKYAGHQISASGKTSVGGDKSGDGIAELKISFSKNDLRALFTGTGLPNGHNTVTVTLEADLSTGGKLRGTTQLDVVSNGNFTAATVAPNPLNPEATLTFTTSHQGAVRIDLFDVHGRLVRRLVDDPAVAAGSHEAIINGRGSRGEKLPSGVYYIRGTSAEGEFKQLVTILK